MKKFLPLILASVCVLSANAEKTYMLVCTTSTDGLEEMLYDYDENFRVTKICSGNQMEPQYNNARVFTYNDKGQCISEELYQDMDVLGTWDIAQLHYNSKIEYDRNEAGQIVERRNYNNWSDTSEPEMTLGGVTTYEYNEDGTLKSATIYWDAEKTMLGQKIDYAYNDAAQLVKKEEWMPDWMSGDMMLIGSTEFTYFENGLRDNEVISYDDGTGSLMVDSSIKYVYDEDGNLTQKSVASASGEVRERYDFNFFSLQEQPAAAENIAYPINIEDDVQNYLYEHFTTLVPANYDVWAMSVSTNKLEYYATYNMDYDTSAGLKGVNPDNGSFGLRALSKDNILLDGVGNGRVRIYNMSGQMIMDTNANQGNVNISSLPAGMYCVYTANGAVKISK